MNLLWKLLREHVSVTQLVGFFVANLLGMLIILFGLQFYADILPLFQGKDAFFKREFLIVSKPVSTLGSLLGGKGTFSAREIQGFRDQPFTRQVGTFTSSLYDVSASIGMLGTGMQVGTEMFFESVPDDYIDVNAQAWTYEEGSRTIPIILPRNYLNLYNFGFAQSRNLPKLSEGVLSMIRLEIRLSGGGHVEVYDGRIVGFSNRLNTILVPEAFMNWANHYYAPGKKAEPSRLIVEVNNPADEEIVKYIQARGYEVEGNTLDAGKTVWFLQILVGIVLFIGIVITFLSFYILILSIFLLLQKNTKKMQTLLLIGYSPVQVALPYQVLAVGLNLGVTGIACVLLYGLRRMYLNNLQTLFPSLEGSSGHTVLAVAGFLFLFVSIINIGIIHYKLRQIWNGK
ncbi:putative ATP/GTP-binding transmembrane protein [Bacteroides sp. CAG:462]|nr:putative ATP/GTP-binding transmembrane protein [Bacteroides sp. CAG:462]